jgi:CPA1 family monovalent cation:H+ antiporter
MLATSLPASAPELLWPIILTIVIVAVARALSIYPVVGVYNWFAQAANVIPRSWQHVLAWGSLRGALAVTMVLLIPDDLTFPGWEYAFTPKELILTLIVSCVFATLFIKATTIGALMKALNLNTFTKIEEINYREMLIYIYDVTLKKLTDAHQKGYVAADSYEQIVAEQKRHIAEALSDLEKHATDRLTLEKVVRLYAIGIERKYIRELYANGEVTEAVIKRVIGKLEHQTEAIERATFSGADYDHGRSVDIFEVMADWLRKISPRPVDPLEEVRTQYLYYRALSIISRKVVKELNRLDGCFDGEFTGPSEVVLSVIAVYEQYRDGSQRKLGEIEKSHPTLIAPLDEHLARCALYKNETTLLEALREREMVTPKVSIALHEHFSDENKVEVR